MNVRLLFEGADNPPLVRGDILEVREVPLGQPVKTDTASATNSNLTLIDVPLTSQDLLVAAGELLSQLLDLGDGTSEPILLNERRYTINWAALTQGQQNQFESQAPGQRRGMQGAWPAFRDLELTDRSTLLPVTLASVMLPSV